MSILLLVVPIVDLDTQLLTIFLMIEKLQIWTFLRCVRSVEISMKVQITGGFTLKQSHALIVDLCLLLWIIGEKL
ncbi:hypothetical protein SDC9_102750 [bioreactor metagenome]|uniref:Uncharacterized protein n=1 Tax=bioreactor metagenome TaxID=1076179 RepID=A0A645ARP9_9ZZZZ